MRTEIFELQVVLKKNIFLKGNKLIIANKTVSKRFQDSRSRLFPWTKEKRADATTTLAYFICPSYTSFKNKQRKIWTRK